MKKTHIAVINKLYPNKGEFHWYSGQFANHKYAGEFQNGAKNGKGIYYWPNGNRYEGIYKYLLTEGLTLNKLISYVN